MNWVNDTDNSNIYSNLKNNTYKSTILSITVMVIMLPRIANHIHFSGKTVEPLWINEQWV